MLLLVGNKSESCASTEIGPNKCTYDELICVVSFKNKIKISF